MTTYLIQNTTDNSLMSVVTSEDGTSFTEEPQDGGPPMFEDLKTLEEVRRQCVRNTYIDMVKTGY